MELWHLAVSQGLVLAVLGWIARTILAGVSRSAASLQWQHDHEQSDRDAASRIELALKELRDSIQSLSFIAGPQGIQGIPGNRGPKGPRGRNYQGRTK